MDPRVPLVVPEINPDRVADHQGIISCPNCTTIPLVMALEPLRRRAGLKRAVVTTFQSVTGAGLPGLEELEAQQAARGAREPLPPPKAFPAQIADNVIPICETLQDDGYTSEEHKLNDESRKILELPSFEVSMTCVRVPVPVGHSASVLVETERPLSVEEATEALRAFPGIEVYANGPHPTPADIAGRDVVGVGRLRRTSTPIGCGCGKSATTCARAPPPTRCRSPRSSSVAAWSATRARPRARPRVASFRRRQLESCYGAGGRHPRGGWK